MILTDKIVNFVLIFFYGIDASCVKLRLIECFYLDVISLTSQRWTVETFVEEQKILDITPTIKAIHFKEFKSVNVGSSMGYTR